MKRVVLAIVLILLAVTLHARIGGGDSYSGSSDSSSSDSGSSYSSSSDDDDDDYSPSSSGSSGGGSGELNCGSITILFFILGFMVLVSVAQNAGAKPPHATTVTARPRPPVELTEIRQHDPNFSEVVFTDFCYSLFARVYEALGRGQLQHFAPYVAEGVRAGLIQHAPPGLSSIDAIVIGSFKVTEVRKYAQSFALEVEFEANYSETSSRGTERWYVREQWMLERALDILSRPPEQARAEHCPKCGAALETRTDGACMHCGTIVKDGSFDWFVTAIRGVEKGARPPALGGGGGGIEPGLDRITVIQEWYARRMRDFKTRDPRFNEAEFEQRVRYVATELQNAWTSRDWHRARPLETGALFQTHRYWIDEYTRQGVTNRVDDYRIDNVEIAKVASDKFFDAITVRLYASGFDYTVDAKGSVIGGLQTKRKAWSEYWTLVRGRVPGSPDARVCPNCGGALESGQTAICGYCGGKVTAGEFPWVLSRIEQDEAYRG